MKKVMAFLLIFAFFAPYCRAEGEQITYRRIPEAQMKIALTFDDGPHPYYTEKILEILKKYDIKATFFFVGQNIVNYPEAAEAVYKAGHEIGNHTYTHHRLRSMEYSELLSELERCDDAIYEIDEYRPHLFRPPEGAFNTELEKTALMLDYSIILWSIDTRDWEHRSPEKILEHVTEKVKGGDIILMHDYIGVNSPTPEALELIIPALLEKGYSFVTVSELMEAK